jgi:hypothetical protein
MARPKFKKTILWRWQSRLYFLCRALNVGRHSDEVKIIVTEPDTPTGAMYTETEDGAQNVEVIRMQGEATYHSDGSLLLKLPSYNDRTTDEYRNPGGQDTRRRALAQIDEWEPFLLYRVVRPTPYLADAQKDAMIADEWPVFKGPFECLFFLGPTAAPLPPTAPQAEVLRLEGIAHGLDLNLVFSPSEYRGVILRAGDAGWTTPAVLNSMQAVERRRVFRPQVTYTWPPPKG